MKIHVLGLPHTQTTEEFTTCAFTQKAFNLCRMMHSRGHHVVHYGVEGSNPPCTEHVDVMSEKMWAKMIGRPGTGFYQTRVDGELAPYHALFAKNMHDALAARTGAPYTEIVCQTWGGAQCTACEGIPQYLVESGIGYPVSWAQWRVYESYTWMHMHLGEAKLFGGKQWYWAVIPNAFPLSNFTPNPNGQRGEDFLYLGRLNDDKGVGIACDVAGEIGRKIVIVGQGDPAPFLAGRPHVRYMKPVGVEERRKLLANARAVFCLTQFIEPFCGTHVEAMLSGTPVITSDYGVFSETVLHGVTGYRGRTFEQWVWAAKNIDKISGKVCREWAEANYSLQRVALMYEEFFQQILNVRDSGGRHSSTPTGFYERHPGRTQLDWLTRVYPRAAAEVTLDLTRPHEAPAVPAEAPAAPPATLTAPPGVPIVCVAVACKGQAKYLAGAICSLIMQSFPNWQAIISCGDDESEAAARKLAGIDNRITVLPVRTVLGLADARNAALATSKSPYCMALDADDTLAPTYLEKLLPLAGPKTIASCDLQEFGNSQEVIRLLVPADTFPAQIPTSNMLPYASVYPRALWEAVGGYDPLMFCYEDWDFWAACAKAGATLKHVPEPLLFYRIHAESMTLRHRDYEKHFQAELRLRYVDPNDVGARAALREVSEELAAKLARQRQAFPTTARERALRGVERLDGPMGVFEIPASPPITRDTCRAISQEVWAGEYDHPDLPEKLVRVLDIGAGWGAFAVWALQKWPGASIDCFEPNALALPFLRRNARSVRIHPVAVTVQEEALLGVGSHDKPDNWGSLSVHGDVRGGQPVVTVHPRHLPPCDVLKIDAEGVEVEILEHYPHLAGVEVLLYEFHSREHRERLQALARGAGFRMLRETQAGAHDAENVWGPSVWIRKRAATALVAHGPRAETDLFAPGLGTAGAAHPPPVISFVMRVHNEAEILKESLESLFPLVTPVEIVVVLHRCTDASAEIAHAARMCAPARHTVRIFEYEKFVSRAGLETYVTPAENEHSLMSYYRYAFGLAKAPWKIKWDGDFVATDTFRRWIDAGDWSREYPLVLNLVARFPDGSITREPYAYNCLQGFAKRDFWEVPMFPEAFAREDAPEEAAFLHKSAGVKAYWREPPWFAAVETSEAGDLMRLYRSAVEHVGPEPVGLARSCNTEAEVYLARCKALVQGVL